MTRNLIGKAICSNKKAYTEEHAKKASNLALINRKVLLRHYKCQYCGQWHLTSKSRENYWNKLIKYKKECVSEA